MTTSLLLHSHVAFGSHLSSQYLLASTTAHLLVWNMLTCTGKSSALIKCKSSIFWNVSQCNGVWRCQWITWSQIPSVLLQQLLCCQTQEAPIVSVMAVPIPDVHSLLLCVHVCHDHHFFFVTVYIFSPPSDLLALHKSVCPMEVVGAVFLPMKVGNETKSHHHIVKSRLYFMDRKQVCHDVKWYHWGKRIFFSLGSLLSQMGRWEWWRETTTYTPSWGYIWESLHRNLWW